MRCTYHNSHKVSICICGTVKPTAEALPTHWACQKCTLHNSHMSSKCQVCFTVNPHSGCFSKLVPISPPKPVSTHWDCPRCTLHNSHMSSKCRACGTIFKINTRFVSDFKEVVTTRSPLKGLFKPYADLGSGGVSLQEAVRHICLALRRGELGNGVGAHEAQSIEEWMTICLVSAQGIAEKLSMETDSIAAIKLYSAETPLYSLLNKVRLTIYI